MTYTTYLIGDRSPTLAGMGLPGSRFAAVAKSGRNGEHALAVRLIAPSRSGVGNGIAETVPRSSFAMYCSVGVRFRSGFGPCGFANDCAPLPFATRRVFVAAW